MTKTSLTTAKPIAYRRQSNGQRGFTLVEMSVVLLILVLFAALTYPHLVNMEAAQTRRSSYGLALAFVQKARESAINDGVTYGIAYDGSANALRLMKQPPSTNAVGSNTIPPPEDRPLTNVNGVSDMVQVDTLPLANPIKPNNFRAGTTSTDGGSWLIHFFPDGTSDGGGLELDEGNQIQSILVTPDGFAKLGVGNLPEASLQVWTAGTYAQQTTSTTSPGGATATGR